MLRFCSGGNFFLTCSLNLCSICVASPCDSIVCTLVCTHKESLMSNCPAKLLRDLYNHVSMTINVEIFADACASRFKTGQPVLKQADRFYNRSQVTNRVVTYITQASSSFKCLDKRTFTYATPTFITEALRVVTLVQLLLTTVTVN